MLRISLRNLVGYFHALVLVLSVFAWAALGQDAEERPNGDQGQASTSALGDDSPEDEEQKLAEAWLEVYDAIADTYTATTEAKTGESLQLEKHRILTIINPEWAGRHGRFWLWTLEGRPIATTALLTRIVEPTTGARTMMFEFHSLSDRPVQLMWRDAVYWQSREPGIDWMKYPTDDLPSLGKTGRLVQMRQIAKGLVARSESRPNKVQGEIFRLMPQPVYRYPDDTPGVIDGAVFAYGVSSDPSVLMLIEVRDSDGFWIAFARSNAFEITVRENEKILWTVKEGDSGRERPFWYFRSGLYLNNDPSAARATLVGE